jgi:hypothetical protein
MAFNDCYECGDPRYDCTEEICYGCGTDYGYGQEPIDDDEPPIM